MIECTDKSVCVCVCSRARERECILSTRKSEWVSGYRSSGVGTKPYYPAFSAAGLDGNYSEKKHRSG